MRWKIQIEGDKKYLEDLCNVFNTLNFDPKIYKDGENYYLEGSIFESLEDAKEVSSKAKTLLALILTTNFKPERIREAFKISKIFYEDKNKRVEFDQDGNLISEQNKGSGNIKFSGRANTLATSKLVDSAVGNESIRILKYDNKGKIIGGLTTIEEINDYIKANNNSESLENIAEYLKPLLEQLISFSSKFSNETPTKDIVRAGLEYGATIELAKWVTLRKIYETIRDDKYFENTRFKGGKDFIDDVIGEDSADNFYYTASKKHIHSETTVMKNKDEKPKREIPLSEAEDLISTLLLKYIEEKTISEKDG